MSNSNGNGIYSRNTKGKNNNGTNSNNIKLPVQNGGTHTKNTEFDYSNKGSEAYDNLKDKYLIGITLVRFLALLGWSGGIIYSTYHVYLAAEEFLPFNGNPEMNPGPLTSFLNRGRDTSDHEWVSFAPIIWTKLLMAFALYKILKQICSSADLKEVIPIISPSISILLSLNLMGFLPVCQLLTASVVYWLLMRLHKKFLIWTVTMFYIFYLNSVYIHAIFPDRCEDCLYFFIVALAWNLSRSVSFCMDMWDRPDEEKFSLESFFKFIQYLFYLPLVVTGPFVTFEHFEKVIINNSSNSLNKHNFVDLGKSLFKLCLISILIELVYHYLYFNPLSDEALIVGLNTWAICGAIYWLGQIFTLKYKVLYGLPSCLSEFDGLKMYPLPRCPAYIHRYSALWKDFDRGLYTFIVKYIYSPLIKKFNSWDSTNYFPAEMKKLFASFFTFVYIYVWHSTSYPVFVWTAFNFLGITIERVGSLIKKKVDNVKKLKPMTWDFIIEPLVTVPLAMMSILNSSVFCANLMAASAFYNVLLKTCTANYSYHIWICCFMYCFTHIGVTVRTWGPFSKIIKTRLNQARKLSSHLD